MTITTKMNSSKRKKTSLRRALVNGAALHQALAFAQLPLGEVAKGIGSADLEEMEGQAQRLLHTFGVMAARYGIEKPKWADELELTRQLLGQELTRRG